MKMSILDRSQGTFGFRGRRSMHLRGLLLTGVMLAGVGLGNAMGGSKGEISWGRFAICRSPGENRDERTPSQRDSEGIDAQFTSHTLVYTAIKCVFAALTTMQASSYWCVGPMAQGGHLSAPANGQPVDATTSKYTQERMPRLRPFPEQQYPPQIKAYLESLLSVRAFGTGRTGAADAARVSRLPDVADDSLQVELAGDFSFNKCNEVFNGASNHGYEISALGLLWEESYASNTIHGKLKREAHIKFLTRSGRKQGFENTFRPLTDCCFDGGWNSLRISDKAGSAYGAASTAQVFRFTSESQEGKYLGFGNVVCQAWRGTKGLARSLNDFTSLDDNIPKGESPFRDMTFAESDLFSVWVMAGANSSARTRRQSRPFNSEHIRLVNNRNEESANGVPLKMIAIMSLVLSALAFPSLVNICDGHKWVARERSENQNKPILRPRKIGIPLHESLKPRKLTSLRRLVPTLAPSGLASLLMSFVAVSVLVRPLKALTDLRQSIIDGGEPCFQYNSEANLFQMTCNVLQWKNQGYGANTYISLGVSEVFDGENTVDNQKSFIDLSGVIDFQGLFNIASAVTTFVEAPLIKNVHVKNGTVANQCGFLVRKEQQYFKVDSCSSTGNIGSYDAGGICGAKSGHSYGKIKIVNSWSTGSITGSKSGGITGSGVGYNGGIVNIKGCYSMGDIVGREAGGICGAQAGNQAGEVYITQSYSTGDIVPSASESGGIVGKEAGLKNGYISIEECSSSGHISADNSGGISGSTAGYEKGELHILDCYSRGDIDGDYAGGITGYETGGCCVAHADWYGDVHINRTYAAGTVKHHLAGGIVGHISSSFQGHAIHVQYSLYNNEEEGKVIGEDQANHLNEKGNSNDLTKIRGQLYHYEGERLWNNDTWVVEGADTLPILRFQLPPTPSPTPSSTATTTPTASNTPSKTPTPTTTRSATVTPTETLTPTTTRTATSSSSETPTVSSSPSTSNSRTPTTSVTSSPSETSPPSASPSRTPSFTSSPTASSSATPSPSASSPTGTSTPTTTQLRSPPAKSRILPVQLPPRSVRQLRTKRKRR